MVSGFAARAIHKWCNKQMGCRSTKVQSNLILPELIVQEDKGIKK